MQISRSKLRSGKTLKTLAMLAIFCGTLAAATAQSATRSADEIEREAIALSLATMLRSARAVVSDHQGLINDPTLGEKGFTSAFMLEEAGFNYEIETGQSLDQIEPDSLHGQLIGAQLQVITEIVDEAQQRINKKGVAYKGFLPAIFAGLVTQKFNARVGKTAQIRLTAPRDYIRNAANMPDAWESTVIEERLRSSSHPYGKHIADWREKDGRRAYRLIVPEYYGQSCLACHGHPRGEVDITGGAKEGGSLGSLGGAISVVLF